MSAFRLIPGILLIIVAVGAPRADIVGYWTFDSIDNSVIPDESGNGLDGRLGRPVDRTNDPVSSENTPSGKPGDRSIQVNGSGGVVVGDYEQQILDLSDGQAITMEVWLYPEEVVTDWTGLVQYGQSGQGYKIGIRGNGEFLFTLLGVVDVSTPTIYIEPDGQWHHLAAIWEPGIGVTFYHNGEEMDFVAETRDMIVPAAKELWIGVEHGAQYGFACTLDRVRISEGVVAPEDLDSDPANPKQPTDQTRFYMAFDEQESPYPTLTEPLLFGVTSGEWLSSEKVPEIVPDGPTGDASDMAAVFAGAGELAHVPDSDGALSFFDHSFTVEAWLKYTGLEFGTSNILSYGEANTGYALQISRNTSSLIWDYKGSETLSADNTIVPSDGEWHHVAVVNDFEALLARFYVDGELTDELLTDMLINMPQTTPVLFIGARHDSRVGYAGEIDRIRISDTALAADELDSEAGGTRVDSWMLRSQ